MFSVEDYLLTALLLSTAGFSSQDCFLPGHPAHGRHEPSQDDCPKDQSASAACRSVPGTSVTEGWLLFIVCNQGFVPGEGNKLDTPHVCADGAWSPPLFSCVYDLESDDQKCILPHPPTNGKIEFVQDECGLTNSSATTPGTAIASSCVLIFSCDEGYQLPFQENQVLVICENATWSPQLVDIICDPIDTNLITPSTTASVPTTRGCVLPAHPPYRKFCSFYCADCSNCPMTVGGTVPEQALKVYCADGYGLDTNQDYATVVCVNQTWVQKIPECLKQCSRLESDSLDIKCFYNTIPVDCSQRMLQRTIAKFSCKPSYQENPIYAKRGIYSRPILCLDDGEWSTRHLPECEPDCGISGDRPISFSPAVVDGNDTMLGQFPWHAGLYIHFPANNSFEYKCGGSLITTQIVLTAAHCVHTKNVHHIKVALGKYYQSWDHDEPQTAVKRNVSDLRIPEEYNGHGLFAWDIALLLLTEKVQVNSVVMPVCRNPALSLDVALNSMAYVVGWGRTSDSGPGSETLLSNNITIRPYDWCWRQIPGLQKYEKFCGTKGTVSVVQRGDSGGGLTVVIDQLHFIAGIVSVKITSKPVSLFTNISWSSHRAWLEREILSLEHKIIYTNI